MKSAALLAAEAFALASAAFVLSGSDVALAERIVSPSVVDASIALPGALGVAIAVGLAAALLEKKRPLAPLARALVPLLALAVVPARAWLGFAPHLIEAVLAPVAVGAGVARAVALLPAPRSRAHAGWLVAVAAVAATVAFYVHARGLIDGLALGYRDAGDYGARIANTARGAFLRQGYLPGEPPFFDHWNPGLLLLVPPYAIAGGGVAFFQLLQALALGATVVVAFGLARRRLGDPWSAALVALALLFAPAFSHLNAAGSYGFHPTTLALPALLGAAVARRRVAILLIIIAWSFEETVLVATFGAGVALALAPRTRKTGVALAAASLVGFLIIVSVVLPVANGRPYHQIEKYAHLGSSLSEVALSPVLRPRAFFATIASPATLAFLATLLAPWLFLPARRPRALLAAAPILVFACLRDEPFVKSIVLHYHALALAALFVGLVEATRARGRGQRRALAAGVLACSVASALLFGDAPLGRARRAYSSRGDRSADVAALAAAVRTDETVAATSRLATCFVAARPDVLVIHDDLVPDARVFALDFLDGFALPVARTHRIARDLRARGLHPRAARSELILFAADGREVEPSPSRDGAAIRSFPEAGLELLAVEPRGIWRTARPTNGDWGFALVDASGAVLDVAPVGGFARPTYLRRAGETFEDDRALEGELILFDWLDLDRRGLNVETAVEARRSR